MELLLDDVQLKLLEGIRAWVDSEQAEPFLVNKKLASTVTYLKEKKYIEGKNGFWDITEEGRRILQLNQREISEQEKEQRREEKKETQQRTKNTRDWLSLTVSAIALIVSIIALVLK